MPTPPAPALARPFGKAAPTFPTASSSRIASSVPVRGIQPCVPLLWRVILSWETHDDDEQRIGQSCLRAACREEEMAEGGWQPPSK